MNVTLRKELLSYSSDYSCAQAQMLELTMIANWWPPWWTRTFASCDLVASSGERQWWYTAVASATLAARVPSGSQICWMVPISIFEWWCPLGCNRTTYGTCIDDRTAFMPGDCGRINCLWPIMDVTWGNLWDFQVQLNATNGMGCCW